MFFRKLFANTSSAAIAAQLPVAAPAPAQAPESAPATTHPPVAAPVDLGPALKEAQDAADTLKAEIAMKDATITSLTDELKVVREQFESAKAEYAKSRDEVAQEIRQKEMATIAASQGIPLEEVPPSGAGEPEATKETRESLMEQYKSATTNRERGVIMAKYKTLK